MAEKERKYKLSFRFVSTQRVIENSKQIAKKFKKLQNTIMASFQAIIRGEMPRNGENKTIVLFRSNLTFKRKFQKNRKKLKKTKKKYHCGFI